MRKLLQHHQKIRCNFVFLGDAILVSFFLAVLYCFVLSPERLSRLSLSFSQRPFTEYHNIYFVSHSFLFSLIFPCPFFSIYEAANVGSLKRATTTMTSAAAMDASASAIQESK